MQSSISQGFIYYIQKGSKLMVPAVAKSDFRARFVGQAGIWGKQ
jgi:hypothetical protein